MPCSFSLSKPTARYNTHTSLPKKLQTVVGVKFHCRIFFLQQCTTFYMYTYSFDKANLATCSQCGFTVKPLNNGHIGRRLPLRSVKAVVMLQLNW